MASFGSGAGSDAFSFTVQSAIEESRGVSPTVKSMIAKGTKIDYSTYTKFRGKLTK
jgi:hydroxymethylglutaryl-CoA synthase